MQRAEKIIGCKRKVYMIGGNQVRAGQAGHFIQFTITDVDSCICSCVTRFQVEGHTNCYQG